MKVAPRPETSAPRARSTPGRFHEELKKTPPLTARAPSAVARGPRALPTTAPRGLPGGTWASAGHLAQVRQGANAEAHRLHDVAGTHQRTARERVDHRLGELLARELAREPGVEHAHEPPARPDPALSRALPEPLGTPSGLRGGEPRGAGEGNPGATPSSRVQATLELIDKLELFVKSQRPALALHLGGALDTTVEVERTGPREVALRLTGRRGPLPPEDVSRLREALAARGLTLRALTSG
jgi:hypothetical protein